MTKQEFLDILRRSLARELSEAEVAEHINYYVNYIEQQITGGKSEEEVLRDLGDPRLIAKTILQVDQRKEEEENDGLYRESVYSEDENGDEREAGAYDGYGDRGFGGTVHVHRLGIRGWLILIGILIFVIALLGLVFSVLWTVLPFLLAGGAILWIYRRFTGR